METSTPGTPSGARKPRRRSWFEGTPTGLGSSIKYEIAVERQSTVMPPSPTEGEMETLVLSHFTASPRVDFGPTRVEKAKIRYLRIHNPQDYTQAVKLEKFPYKKHFSTDLDEFDVDPGEDFILKITWNPQESGNCREMVLFKVESCYRLQAIFFGIAEEPPKPKKGRKKPFSVIQPTGPSRQPIKTQPAKPVITKQYQPNGTKCQPSQSKGPKLQPTQLIGTKTQTTEPKGTKPQFTQSKGTKSHPNQPKGTKTTQPVRPDWVSEFTPDVNSDHLECVKENIAVSHETYSVEEMHTSERRETYITQAAPVKSGPRRVVREQQVDLDPRRETYLQTHPLHRVSMLQQTADPLARTYRMTSQNQHNDVHEVQHVVEEQVHVEEIHHQVEYEITTEEHIIESHTEHEITTDTQQQHSMETYTDIQHTIETYTEHMVTESMAPQSGFNTPTDKTLQKDDPQFTETPIRRETFQKDDPAFVATPIRRETFVKDDPVFEETPIRKQTFDKDDSAFPGTPIRRQTFQKDDPNMPVTPLKRMTFIKAENAMPNTPTIEVNSPECGTHTPSVAMQNPAASYLTPSPLAGTPQSPPSTLRRFVTYNNLDNSLSPNKLKHRFMPSSPRIEEEDDQGELTEGDMIKDVNSETSDDPELSLYMTDSKSANLMSDLVNIMKGLPSTSSNPEARNTSPTSTISEYMTPLTTPLDSPNNSDSENDVFEDSMQFLDGQMPTPVIEKGAFSLSALKEALEADKANRTPRTSKTQIDGGKRNIRQRSSANSQPSKSEFSDKLDENEDKLCEKSDDVGKRESDYSQQNESDSQDVETESKVVVQRDLCPENSESKKIIKDENDTAESKEGNVKLLPTFSSTQKVDEFITRLTAAIPDRIQHVNDNHSNVSLNTPPLHEDTVYLGDSQYSDSFHDNADISNQSNRDSNSNKSNTNLTVSVEEEKSFLLSFIKENENNDDKDTSSEESINDKYSPDSIDNHGNRSRAENQGSSPRLHHSKQGHADVSEKRNSDVTFAVKQPVVVGQNTLGHPINLGPGNSTYSLRHPVNTDLTYSLNATTSPYTKPKPGVFKVPLSSTKPSYLSHLSNPHGLSFSEGDAIFENSYIARTSIRPIEKGTIPRDSIFETVHSLSQHSAYNDSYEQKYEHKNGAVQYEAKYEDNKSENDQKLCVESQTPDVVSPGTMVNEAVSHKDVVSHLSGIKEELVTMGTPCTPVTLTPEHRLSSTPVESKAPEIVFSLLHDNPQAPSPIIGRRVSTATVTKSRPSLAAQALYTSGPQHVAPKEPSSKPESPKPTTTKPTTSPDSGKRQSRRELFTELPPAKKPRPSLSRTRDNPRVTQAPGRGATVGRGQTSKPTVSGKENNRPGTVSGLKLTKTQQLRRQSALQTMEKGKKKSPRKPATGVSKPRVGAKGVATARLTLVKKPTTTALPKHPLPFAAKNMYYDERWMEKQENGFIRWLNFILTPPDEYFEAIRPKKIDAGKLALETKVEVKIAPTKETLSMRAYSAKRKLNRLRRASCALFQSDSIVTTVQKVEREIDCGRLVVRKDRKLHADVGIKQRILDMILSYNPLWLRVGLETIYGEMLPVQDNQDIVGISRFIVTRLLGNPDLEREYAHPTVPHLYRDGYDEALARFTLKKFLILVLFLDQAKTRRIIEHNPCLFCKDSEIKASKEFLLQFSRDYLGGEGDITKHLGYIGYKVTHVQTPLEEFNFGVTNLATDLRDGLRLTRVIEMLTQTWKLSSDLRVPAISRLQKIHNVGVAFTELANRGLNVTTEAGGKILAKDVTDGHREKTLQLLWRIMFNFQVELILNYSKLEEEVCFLEKNLKAKQQLVKIEADYNSLGISRTKKDSLLPDLYFKSPRLQLLLKWVQIVCAHYNIKVENFTVSFSDGRVLCYLIHHYHPCLLPRGQIMEQTTMTYTGGQVDLNTSESGDDSFNFGYTHQFSPKSGKDHKFEELLSNERHNFKLLHDTVKELGGVPLMLKSGEMCNTLPDEKVVITYVTYLCCRLLDICLETRAARRIQLAWRRWRIIKNREMFLAQSRAAVVIQREYRAYISRKAATARDHAVRLLQRNTRCMLARIRVNKVIERKKFAKEHRAATVIQAYSRAYLVQSRLSRCRHAAVVIQSTWRMYVCRSRYNTLTHACVAVQRWYRDTMETRAQRKVYLGIRRAVTKLQGAIRCMLAKRLLHQHRCARTIQSVYRGYRERARLYRIRQAALVIQKRYRSRQQTRTQMLQYHTLRGAAITIQAWIRGVYSRRYIQHLHKQATVIQSVYRMSTCRRRYQATCQAARVIQSRYRDYRYTCDIRRDYVTKRQAVTKIQAYVRCTQQRKRYLSLKHAVTMLQSRARGVIARRWYMRLQAAVIVCQSVYRANVTCKHERARYVNMKRSVVCIQSAFRAYQARKIVKTIRSVVKVQKIFRGFVQRKRYQKTRRGFIQLQALVKARQQHARYSELKTKAVVLQRKWRATLAARQQRKVYEGVRQRMICIQAAFRCYVQRKRYAVIRRGFIKLQALVKARQQQSKFKDIRTNTVIIQRKWRATLAARRQRAVYENMRLDTIKIQAFFKGYAQRKRYQTLRCGFIKLQAIVKAKQQQAKYYDLKAKTTVIQRKWRSTLAARQQRAVYQHIRLGAIKIQTVFRGYTQRKRFEKIRDGFVKLQTVVRVKQQLANYRDLKSKTVVIQRAWRATLSARRQRAVYDTVRRSVVKIQSMYRGYVQRKCYHATIRGFIQLQALVKARQQQAKFNKLKIKAVVIQRKWRASLAARRQRAVYENVRLDVIKIQALFRCHAQRKRFEKMRGGFIALQALVRGRQQEKRYTDMKTKTMVIQRRWRATMAARDQRAVYERNRRAIITIQSYCRGMLARRYVQKLRSVITIQSVFRGYVTRKQLRLQHAATLIMQTWFRMHSQRHKYKKMQQSACKIQTHWRATMLAQTTRREFLMQQKSAIVIQSAYRGHLAHKQFTKQRNLIVKMQSNVRAKQALMRYRAARVAVSKIQNWWRNVQLTKCSRAEYLHKKSAAVTIQSAVRGYITRKAFIHHRQCIIRLQSVVRAKQAVSRYRAQKMAAIVIQQKLRATIEARKQVEKYQKLRSAAIVLQSYTRAYIQRKQFMRLKHAAVTIQSVVRCARARRTFLRLKHAAFMIQLRWRETVLAHAERMNYLEQRHAVVCLQSHWRCYVARQQYLKTQQAVVLIQSVTKGMIQKHKYLTQKSAAITIQRRWRATLAARIQKTLFLIERNAATIIQSYFRAWKERCHFVKTKQAAITIQKYIRGRSQRREFLRVKAAAVIIQIRWRQILLCRVQERWGRIQNHAATTIQAYARGYIARCDYLRQRELVIKCEARIRGVLAVRKYQKLKESVTCIQRRWRAELACRGQRSEFIKCKSAVIVLQSAYRGVVARKLAKHKRAARVIQSVYRGYSQRMTYQRLRAATVMCQAYVRRRQAVNRLHKMRNVTIFIQRRYREKLTTRKLSRDYQNVRQSAVTIQSAFRAYKARQLAKRVRSAVCIQSYVRGYLCRTEYNRKKQAVARIQNAYRSYKCRKSYAKLKHACIVIQRRYRARVVGMTTRARYTHTVRCVVKIQSVVKAYLCRRQYITITTGVTRLQAIVRRRIQHRMYTRVQRSVTCIQRAWRALREARRIRERYLETQEAAVCIQGAWRDYQARVHTRRIQAAMCLQSAWRGLCARRTVARIRSVVLIQSVYRRYVARCRYLHTITMVTRVQTCVRGWLSRRRCHELKVQSRAALCIQMAYRRYRVKQNIQIRLVSRQTYLACYIDVTKRHLSVICIQRWYRRCRAMETAKQQIHALTAIQHWWRSRLVRLRYLQTLDHIRLIQTTYRAHYHRRVKAAIVIQRSMAGWRGKLYKIRQQRAATVLQSYYRGYLVRRGIKCKKLQAARARVEEAARNVTEDKKLCNRTTSALDFLLRYKQLSFILEAVMNLDVATRLSSVCCERLVEGNAVSVIYTLIRCCNRSRPHMEIIKHSVNILLNLAKYDKTVDAVYEAEDSLDTLLELMQIYREKGLIFTKSCTLMGLLAHNPVHREEMKSHPRLVDKLHSFHKLAQRKSKMESQRNLVKSKMAASKSFMSLNSTVLNTTAASVARKPSVAPDWLLGKDKMREIEDPLKAIHFIFRNMQIRPA